MKILYKKLYNLISKGGVKTAILMSGGGSNAKNILSNKNLYPNIDIKLIATDQKTSNASIIASEFGIKHICLEGSVKNDELRAKYFDDLAKLLKTEGIEIILYAGFMKIVTKSFLNKFPGINSHPGDLRIKYNNKRKYVGMDSVKLVIDDGLKEIRCSCFIVERKMDDGKIIAVSSRQKISNKDTPQSLHEKLKSKEWNYYPRVIGMLASKKLNTDSRVYIFNS